MMGMILITDFEVGIYGVLWIEEAFSVSSRSIRMIF